MEYQRVEALLELSGVRPTEDVVNAVTSVQSAPDPETAVCNVMSAIGVANPLLKDKWRKHVSQIWFATHPHIPVSFALPLKSSDVVYAHVLLEAQSLLQEIAHAPIRADRTSQEEVRLAQALSVFRGDVTAVRRMFALFEELHLIRLYRQRFHIVRSRVQRFQKLPLPGQFYLLWHADMYHLDWRQFASEYGASLAIFQQYLPMVWELLMRPKEGVSQRIDELTWQVVRAFRPLWQQQGGKGLSSVRSMIGLYEQSLLQNMVETYLIQKSLARYGLIAYEDDSSFVWTSAGEALLEAERTTKLPCTADLLS